jgi:hypothetical protein
MNGVSSVIVFTKNGRPLLREDDDLYGTSGTHVARLQDGKAYDTNGRYVGTLEGERLLYRMTDSFTIGPLFARTAHAGFTRDPGVVFETMDDEPSLPY